MTTGNEGTHLFRLGEFTSHSGIPLEWKIDCDALTREDWEALAVIALEILDGEPFDQVLACGGAAAELSSALWKYRSPEGVLLVVDDVLTTGATMERHRLASGRICRGIVVFARGPCPPWVRAIFTLSPEVRRCPS